MKNRYMLLILIVFYNLESSWAIIPLCKESVPQKSCKINTVAAKTNNYEVEGFSEEACYFSASFKDVSITSIVLNVDTPVDYICQIENETSFVFKPVSSSELVHLYQYLKFEDTKGGYGFITFLIASDAASWPVSVSGSNKNVVTIHLENNMSPLLVDLNDYLIGLYGGMNTFSFVNLTKNIKTIENSKIEISYNNFQPIEDINFSINNTFGHNKNMVVDFIYPELYKDDASLADLKIELAMVRKLRADEVFIKKDTAGITLSQRDELTERAKYIYNSAYKELLSINLAEGESISSVNRATKNLLESDIKYRLKLLEKDISFWGGYRFLSPTTPHHEWIKLRDLMKEFENIHDRMESLEVLNSNVTADASELDAKKSKILGEIQQLRYDKEIATISKKRAKQNIYNHEWQLKEIAKIITEKVEQMDKLAEAQESLASKATAQLNDLIASSSGIPLNTIAAAMDGDLEKAVLQTVATELADSNSNLSKQLGSLNENAKEFIEIGKDLNEKYENIKELKNNIDYVAATIRDPSIESLLKTGEIVFKNLDAETQEKLQENVDKFIIDNKPTLSHLQSYYNYAKKGEKEYKVWKNFAKTTLSKIKGSEGELIHLFKSESNRLIKEATNNELVDFSKKVLSGLPELKRGQEEIFYDVLNIAPELLSHANEDFKSVLNDLYPNYDYQSIVQLIQENTEGLKIDNKYLLILKQNGDILAKQKINFLLGKIESISELNIDQAKISKLIEKLISEKVDVKSLLINIANPSVLNTKLQQLVKKSEDKFKSRARRAANISPIWKVIKDQPKELRTFANNQLVKMMAASKVQQHIRRNSSNPNRTDTNDFFMPGDSGLNKDQQKAANMALNAAFPGAGAALALAQTWSAMDANTELNDKLSSESLTLMADYQQILASTIDNYYDQSIASAEVEREKNLRLAAIEQRSAYIATIEEKLRQSKNADKKLRLFRPLYFYMAEMLRSRFDYFDRSLALWSGKKDGHGYLFEAIRQNPQNVRLALDSEIQLFDWLNRDRESTKTDPFYLYLHWKKMLALIDQFCVDGGCKPGSGKLGDIAVTPPRYIFSDLIGEGAKNKFKDWKDGGRNNPFIYTIVVNPADNIIPINHINTRIIDINIVAVDKKGRKINGDLISLKHLGQSLIPIQDEYGKLIFRKERFLEKTATVSNQSSGIDKSKLENRFDFENSVEAIQPLRDFEGYGLYGLYEIQINNLRGINKVDDFEIQFSYSFINSDNIYSEEQFYKNIEHIMDGKVAINKPVQSLIINDDQGKTFKATIDFNKNFTFLHELIKENKNHSSKTGLPAVLDESVNKISFEVKASCKSLRKIAEEIMSVSNGTVNPLLFEEAMSIAIVSYKEKCEVQK